MSETVTVNKSAKSRSDLDRISQRLANLQSRLDAISNRNSSANNGKSYNSKDKICTKKQYGEIDASVYITARQPDISIVQETTDASSRIFEGTMTREEETISKIDELGREVFRRKKLRPMTLNMAMRAGRNIQQIKERVELGELQDCFEVNGKYFTKVYEDGTEITGDELKEVLSDINNVSASQIRNNSQFVQAANINMRDPVPIELSLNQNLGDFGDLKLSAGYTEITGTVTNLKATNGLTPGNANLIQTTKQMGFVTKKVNSLMVDDSRHERTFDQWEEEYKGHAINFGASFTKRLNYSTQMNISLSTRIAVESSHTDIIDAGDIVDYKISAGIQKQTKKSTFRGDLSFEAAKNGTMNDQVIRAAINSNF